MQANTATGANRTVNFHNCSVEKRDPFSVRVGSSDTMVLSSRRTLTSSTSDSQTTFATGSEDMREHQPLGKMLRTGRKTC